MDCPQEGEDLFGLPATGIELDFLVKDHAPCCCHSSIQGFVEAVMAMGQENKCRD